LAMIVQVQVEQGDLEGARESIALAAREDRAMLYTTAAEQLAVQGDLDGALQMLRLLRERVPEKSAIEAMSREGLLSRVAKNQDLPLETRRAAVENLIVIAKAHTDDFALFPNGVFPELMDPKIKVDGTDAIDPERWSRIAEICVSLGDTEQAESAIQIAKKLLLDAKRPNQLLLEDAVSLATSQHRLGLLQEAAQTFQQAVEMVPLLDDYPVVRAPAWTAIGKGHIQCGRPAQADAAFEQALQIEAQSENNDGSNAAAIVRILAAEREWKRAKQVCQRVSSPVYRYYAFADIAQSQAANNDVQGAATTIREGLQFADGLPEAKQWVDFFCLLLPIASKIGDSPLVNELRSRASQAASNAADEETELLTPLQRIAQAEIEAGRLSAAWQTIGQIDEPHLKCFPLAELALAAAKAEQKLKQ
jgi:tetratricopeptide (TPR) repeat protein